MHAHIPIYQKLEPCVCLALFLHYCMLLCNFDLQGQYQNSTESAYIYINKKSIVYRAEFGWHGHILLYCNCELQVHPRFKVFMPSKREVPI